MCNCNFNYIDIIILIFIFKCLSYPFENLKLDDTEFFTSYLHMSYDSNLQFFVSKFFFVTVFFYHVCCFLKLFWLIYLFYKLHSYTYMLAKVYFSQANLIPFIFFYIFYNFASFPLYFFYSMVFY
jgi:hypothetical protein